MTTVHEIDHADDPMARVFAGCNAATRRVEVNVYAAAAEPEDKPLFILAGNIDDVESLLKAMLEYTGAINSSASKSTAPLPELPAKP